MSPFKHQKTAVVLAGGGTRGAYEAGVINYIRTQLPDGLGEKLLFNIHVGASVGAINASFMAATAENPVYQGQKIIELWQGLQTDDIYKRGPINLGKFLFKTVVAVSGHLFNFKSTKATSPTYNFQGLFDTQPFFHFMSRNCPWSQLHKNIESKLVDALVISATNVHTGMVELFVEHSMTLPERINFNIRSGRIQAKHVIASAALPVLFPPVPIHGVYYNDGGLRLKTPLAPAVSLGASRVLIIGTRFNKPPKLSNDEETTNETPIQAPSLAHILGKFFNAVFLDRLETDREQLDRINRILEACRQHVPLETFTKICETAKTLPIETITITPSVDIASLVDETMKQSYKKLKSMGIMERAILRILEVDKEQGSDLLSYFLFERSYITKLVDLGYQDAKAKHDQLVAFAEKSLG